MQLRPAELGDLPQLKAVYQGIIRDMTQRDLTIWDEIYPCAFFEEDIEQNRLYLLLEEDAVVAAFALCSSHAGAGRVKWEKPDARACYLERLGVHADYARGGIGSALLDQAAALAGGRGAEYLRLFVADCNAPAIALYRKNGFQRAEGIYDEPIAPDFVLNEFGLERKITSIDFFAGNGTLKNVTARRK